MALTTPYPFRTWKVDAGGVHVPRVHEDAWQIPQQHSYVLSLLCPRQCRTVGVQSRWGVPQWGDPTVPTIRMIWVLPRHTEKISHVSILDEADRRKSRKKNGFLLTVGWTFILYNRWAEWKMKTFSVRVVHHRKTFTTLSCTVRAIYSRTWMPPGRPGQGAANQGLQPSIAYSVRAVGTQVRVCINFSTAQ